MGLCISSSSSSRRRNSSVELVDRITSLPDEVRVDRISSLPDEVLIQIISLLDMRRAVVTGILSSKWRGLWANIESLDFDGFKYYGIYDYSDDDKNKPFDLLERDDFVKFVVHSLNFHLRPTIHKFRLMFGYKYEYLPYIDEAILFAVRREVKELFIEFVFGFGKKYKLPAFLFGCESLVSLYLKGCNLLDPEYIRFSSLVSLSIVGACLENDSILRVIDGCPLLEDLLLEECAFHRDPLEIWSFSAPGGLPLKRLTLRNNVSCESDMPILIQIEAPKLEVLNLFSFNMYSDSLNNMLSLREVSLEIIPEDADPMFLPILESWLEALHQVRVVKLCRGCIKVLYTSS
ncbi:hypothetical protein AAC387_Pa07g1481 [Persea americana]